MVLEALLRKFSWHFSNYQIVVLSFAILIFTGTLLLMLPWASTNGESLSFLNALFTATSAVCVTGLVVVDTGTHFTIFGQMVIIILIQLGAIGVMTGATMTIVALGRRVNLKQRLLMQESLNQEGLSGMVRLTQIIIKYTFLIEFLAGIILALRFYQDYGLKGIYFGFWHAISAFCNAGFDLLGGYSSLTSYSGDIIINLTIASLIILGGLGFTVMVDVVEKKNWQRLLVHTKVVIFTTGLLIIVGSVGIYILEKDNVDTLGGLSLQAKLLASFFQAVSPRTAGFNTIDLTALNSSTIFLIISLMFVGGSPASTAGGIKTTTFYILIMSVWSMIRGKSETTVFYRSISQNAIHKAYVVFTLSGILVITVSFLLNIFEGNNFLYLFFETISAFATVGLSCGLTPALTDNSKIALIITMFAGRVGPLTLAYALLHKKKEAAIRYPEGKVIIG